MKKKFNIFLISALGISTVLVYVAIGYFLFQRGLLFPEAGASPATCTVGDDLDVTGNIRTIDSVTIDNWDSQLEQGCTWGGCSLQGIKRSIGGAFGWDSNMLYINGWNEWSSGVSIGGPGGVSDLTVTDDLNVAGSMTRAGNTVWDAGNDGSGSGLDADLLDGQQGSYYRNFANMDCELKTSGWVALNNIEVQCSANHYVVWGNCQMSGWGSGDDIMDSCSGTVSPPPGSRCYKWKCVVTDGSPGFIKVDVQCCK